MNGSDLGVRTTEPAPATSACRIVRSVAGLVFLLVAVGSAAVQRTRPEADAQGVTAARPPHAVSGPDAPSRATPIQQLDQATAIHSPVEAY